MTMRVPVLPIYGRGIGALARKSHEKEPSDSINTYNSVAWTGSNQEPDGDGMEPRYAFIFKVSAASDLGGYSRRFDSFQWQHIAIA